MRDYGQEKCHNRSTLADLCWDMKLCQLSDRSSLHLIHLQLVIFTFVAVKWMWICVLYTGYVKHVLFLNTEKKSSTVIVIDHKLSMILILVFNTVTLKNMFLSYTILAIFTYKSFHLNEWFRTEQSIYPVYIFYLCSSTNCLIEWFDIVYIWQFERMSFKTYHRF